MPTIFVRRAAQRSVGDAHATRAAGVLEHARQADAAVPHVVDVRLRAGVAVLEGAFVVAIAPEHPVVAKRQANSEHLDESP